MYAYQAGGSAHIQSLIAAAMATPERTATVTGDWLMEEAVLIPSECTLILDGCHLRQADGIFDNMFRNEHCGTVIGRTPAGTDRSIRILGKNGATLDGGTYNGLSEKNAGKDGRPMIWQNNMLLFTNVDGFEISGIRCENQRWWALNFLFCRNGRIAYIDFCSSDIWVDENGGQHHGLHNCQYSQILVKNSDGIDLRQGCHHILIEHITGFTEDDTVALTALNGPLEENFSVDGLPTDIAYVTVRDVASAAYCSNIRLLNQGDIALHHIIIEGMQDTSACSPYMSKGIYGIRIGDADAMYGSRPATAEETHHITVRNVCSRAHKAALHLAGAIGALTVENITAEEGTTLCDDRRTVKTDLIFHSTRN